jgi:hypothetical protein
MVDAGPELIRINFCNDEHMFMDKTILELSSRVLTRQFASGMMRDKYIINFLTISKEVFRNTIYAWMFKSLHVRFDWQIIDVLERLDHSVIKELYTIVDQYEWDFKTSILHFVELQFKTMIMKFENETNQFEATAVYVAFPFIEFFLMMSSDSEEEQNYKMENIKKWIDFCNFTVLKYYKNNLNDMVSDVATNQSIVSAHYNPSIDDLRNTNESYKTVIENISVIKKMLLSHLNSFFVGHINDIFCNDIIEMMIHHPWLFDTPAQWEDHALNDYSGTMESILLLRQRFGDTYPLYAECRALYLKFLDSKNIVEQLLQHTQGKEHYVTLCEYYMYTHIDETLIELQNRLLDSQYTHHSTINKYINELLLIKKSIASKNFFLDATK